MKQKAHEKGGGGGGRQGFGDARVKSNHEIKNTEEIYNIRLYI